MDKETIANQRKVQVFNNRTQLKLGEKKGLVIKHSPRLLKTKAQFPVPSQISCMIFSTSFGPGQQAPSLASISMNFSAHIYAWILLPTEE